MFKTCAAVPREISTCRRGYVLDRAATDVSRYTAPISIRMAMPRMLQCGVLRTRMSCALLCWMDERVQKTESSVEDVGPCAREAMWGLES